MAGDPAYDEIEALLALQPAIHEPSIVPEGEENGVDSPMPVDLDRPHFVGSTRKSL